MVWWDDNFFINLYLNIENMVRCTEVGVFQLLHFYDTIQKFIENHYQSLSGKKSISILDELSSSHSVPIVVVRWFLTQI